MTWPTLLQPLPDPGAVRWISDGVMRLYEQPGTPAGLLVPRGFAAYLRILHRASREHPQGPGPAMRWRDVAAEACTTLHPLAQFAKVARLETADSDQAQFLAPAEGQLDDESADALIAMLRHRTERPEQCVFAVWDGWGYDLEDVPLAQTPPPGIEIGLRSYLVGLGPIDYAARLPMPPAYWWPADRAWLVATDIDMNSTLVGCTGATAELLLRDARLEAFEITRESRIDEDADTIN